MEKRRYDSDLVEYTALWLFGGRMGSGVVGGMVGLVGSMRIGRW